MREKRIRRHSKVNHSIASSWLRSTALPMGAVLLLSMTATPAAAQCVVNGAPAVSGTAGDDTVLCDAANAPTTTLSTLGGDDSITIDGGITIPFQIDGGDNDDTLNFLSGTTNGFIRFGAGNDTVILYDGANFPGRINGGAQPVGGGDTLIFRTAVSQTLDGDLLSGFEQLIKEDAGTLTNIGTFPLVFTNGVQINGGTLHVGYAVLGPTFDMADDTTLIIDGVVASPTGSTTVLTGSSGVNSITVTDANTFSTPIPGINGLVATGDLGDGADQLTTAFIVNTLTGTLSLGLGDDTFTLNDGADVRGIVSGGAGNDQVIADIATAGTATVDRMTDFETLTKTGAGTLIVEGADASNIGVVNINAGTLNVAAGGSIIDVETASVASGATIDLAGSFSFTGGADTFDVSGALAGTGAFDLLGGDDTLNLGDGADLNGLTSAIDGGLGNDLLRADISTSAVFGASAGFETLTKTGAGALTVVGPAGSSFDTVNVNAGTLAIDAASSITNVSTASVLGGAILNVDGAFSFTGGDDTLTVLGTVTGATTIDLGAGNDTFTFQEGAATSAPVDGGAGTDMLHANILTTGSLAQATNFETLTKTGAGVLDVTGPGVSDFSTVNINEGTLDIAAAGSITNVNAASVAAGAMLDADGAFGFTTGGDTFDISGALAGGGTFNMQAGDDTLTLRDGADLSGYSGVITGGLATNGDTVVVDITTTVTFDGDNFLDFEDLQKHNTGTLNVTGTAAFSGATAINGGTLDVAAGGTLGTTTMTAADGTMLTVAGTVNNIVGSQPAITGSTGVNTVIVAAGGNLLATGDLGDGADVLDVVGTLDTGAGTFALGAGNDTFTINDGTTVIGIVDGGAGTDIFNTDIATTASVGATLGFETLLKTGAGVLNLTGPAASAFDTINVNDGTVDADGAINGVSAASVLAGATFNVDGPLSFTAGADTLTVAGTISGASAIDLGAGDDTFTFQEEAVTSVPVDGGTGTDTLNANIVTTGSLARAANFETLTKTGAGVLNVTGPGVSDFATVNVNQGTLDVAAAGSFTSVNAATVAAGATLDADGAFSFTTGADTFDVAGVVTGSGTFDMLGGDDTLTLRDGANLSSLTSVIDGGGAATNDRLVLDNALALSFSSDRIVGFEQLTKQNAGVASLVGAHSYSSGTTVNGGTLDVDGTTETPTVTLADGTVLNVDGTVRAAGPTQATITGSAGVNTINVAGTLRADGDLGDGADVLDVTGTLDTGAGTFALGAGNDTFTINDGTTVIGIVDGGAGTDIFNTDIATAANLGAAQGFETLDKTGAGVLNVTGPATSMFDTVNVNQGTLDIAAAGSFTEVNAATVAAGATLETDGAFGFTGGGDTFDVAGVVTGGGAFDMLGADDTLTLRDGADLSGFTGTIDGNAGADTVTIDNASAVTFSGSQVTNFETLRKDNSGALTVTGAQSFSGGTTLNGGTLDVDGTYETPSVAMADATTLNVDGTAQAAGATQTAITGSAGVNTVSIAGGLLASADLGDGADVLDVTGTLDSGAGIFALGLGDDTFTLNDGAAVLGTVDGGTGADTINTDIATSATLGASIGFEMLTKTGAGVLHVAGPAASSFDTVNVNAGTLNIAAAGAVTNVNRASIAEGAALITDGSLLFTPGSDLFDLAGALSGAGDINMLDDDDAMIIRAGADISGFTATIDGGDGVDRVEFYSLVGVLPDAFTNFEEIYLLNETTADAHLPGDGMRTLDAMLFVSADSRFIADGNSPGVTNITGDFVNLGVITMADGAADDRINVGGNYAGGGVLEIDAALDQTAAADLLVIEGNVGAVTTTLAGTVTSNPTLLSVTDVGTGSGVETGTGPGAGIAVVDVSATGATAGGDFVLENPLVAGEYTYDLNLETDGIWYLQSELLEQVAGYSSALPGMVGIMTRSVALGGDSHAARAGQADYFYHDADTGACEATEGWTRARGGRLRETPEVGPRLRQSYRQLDLGSGRALQAGDSGCFKFAARGIIGLADSDAYPIDREAAGAELDTRYYGGGFSATLQRNNGFYVDLSSQALRFDTDVAVYGEGVKARIDAWGVSASVESGLRVDLSDDLYITPRIQLNWNGLYGDDFVDEDGAKITFGDNHQFSITQGIILAQTSDAEWAGDETKLAVYGVFDLQFNINRDLSISSSGDEFEYVGNRVWTRVGAGATLALNENASFYGEFSGTGALSGSMHDSHGFEGNLGFRVRW